MTGVEIENRGAIARTTCGWRKPGLSLDAVRRYWRDVHSPAISRRLGIYWYRHCPFDPVSENFLGSIDDIETACPPDRQLQWQSDVVYRDEAGLGEFLHSPDDTDVMSLVLADIDLIVDKSTTYKAIGENLHTFIDRTNDAVPIGEPPVPRYGLFFRARSNEEGFRRCLRRLVESWSTVEGVLRLRLNLFDVPDMESERKAGYPVKTHPVEDQYQAWADLVVSDPGVGLTLGSFAARGACTEHVLAVHAYPVPAMYTFVYDGRPTLIGLRGYAAYCAIRDLGATHASDRRLLEWMYGAIVDGSARGGT